MAMNNFTFYNPTKIFFGKDQIRKLNHEIPKDAKVLLLYGGGSIKQYGVFDRVVEALGDRQWGEFGGIEANPVFETLMEAVAQIKKDGYDYLLALGGGSVIDGTKFIAAAVPFDGDPIDIFAMGIGKGLPVKSSMPFGTVLTLPATGSEMNSDSVISFKEKGAKVSFDSVHSFPQFSVLEPETTYTLPVRQRRNGIADGYIHVLENYLTHDLGGDIPDYFSEGILKTFIKHADAYINEDSKDYEVASNVMWACTMALNGVASKGNVGDWSTHSLGHEITAFNHTDHAKTLTPIILATMDVRRDEKHAKILRYARNIWHIEDKDEEKVIDKAIERTAAFFESIGMPTKLRQVGIQEEDINSLVNQLEAHKENTIGENASQNLDTSRKIYQRAL